MTKEITTIKLNSKLLDALAARYPYQNLSESVCAALKGSLKKIESESVKVFKRLRTGNSKAELKVVGITKELNQALAEIAKDMHASESSPKVGELCETLLLDHLGITPESIGMNMVRESPARRIRLSPSGIGR